MILLCLALLFSNVYTQNYKEIFEEGIKKAEQWKRPTRNEDFSDYQQENCEDYEDFDFVIVGAGSAGAVIANRLSEETSWKILLLEAGEDESDFTLMPGAFPGILNTPVNWGYLTVPQKNVCQGSINKQCDCARGKVLGGGSSMNAMLFVRGHPNDFDSWPEEWSYENVLEYFKKAENSSLVRNDPYYRGFDGPLSISYPKPQPPLLDEIISAHEELGSPFVPDYNSGYDVGVSQLQINIKDGKRFSTNQAYLKPIHDERKNLKILTKALATKINFKSKKAVSLKFLHEKKCFVVHAKKEIIISAGAFNSPQLLLLSGIGPKTDLSDLGIELIADLPVGQNLEDHATIFNINFDTNYTRKINLEESLEDYSKGEGWMTYNNDFEVNFLNFTNSGVPDVEIIYGLGKPIFPINLLKAHSNYDKIMDPYLESMKPTYVYAHHILLHPKSKGTVTLKSKDPLDFPIINPNYLDHPDDVELLYKAVQATVKLVETDAFKKLNAKLADIPIEPCEDINNEKEKWYCIFKYLGQGMFHPACTCRMGTDPTISVVDINLKVHGIEGLRVADASVLPDHTSGHLNALAIMIGEKISDHIKEEW